MSLAVSSVPLIGRDRLASVLDQQLAALTEGGGRSLMLVGEPGIGKTRLLDELAARARRRGYTVSWGRCVENSALVEPYGPWRSVLRPLGLPVPAMNRSAAWPADLVDRLAAAAAVTPLVVCLDDLQWADEGSLRLLHAAIAGTADAAVLLAGSRRIDLEDGDPRTADLLAALPSSMVRMTVEALGPDQVGEFVSALTGCPVTPDLLDRVVQRTGGNPFFVREVTALLAESANGADTAVPPGARDVLNRRLARLPARCREVLGVLSVLGEQATFDDVAAVCGTSDVAVRRQLDPAVRSGWIHTDPARRRMRFVHGLVRDCVYQGQSPETVAVRHRRVAQALEPTAGPEVLFWHWRLSSGADAGSKAAGYALAAGHAAKENLSYGPAAAFFGAALELRNDTEPQNDAELQNAITAHLDVVAVLLELADALLRAGDGAGADQAWWKAAEAARRAHRPVELARAAIGFGAGTGGFEVRGHDPRQTGLLHDALDGLADSSPALRALVLARLSVSLGFEADPACRAGLASQSVSVAELSGDPNAQVQALAAVCDAHAGPADTATRTQASDRMLILARRARDTEGELLAHRFAVVAALEVGDFRTVDEHIAAFERLSTRLRQPQYQWYVPLWRGMRATMAGRLAEAAGYRAESQTIGEQARSFNAFLLNLSQRMTIDREHGDLTEVLAVYDDLLTGHIPVQARATLAALYADTGDLQRARATLAPLVLTGLSELPIDADWLSALSLLSRAAIACGDSDATRMLLRALVPFADRWVIDGIGASCWGIVAETIGRLATVLGEYQQATVHLDQAREAYAGCGALLLTSHALDASARLALRRGDPDEARKDVAQCVALRRQLGVASEAAVQGGPTSVAAHADGAKLVHDGPTWALAWGGATAVLPDAKGLHDLGTLLANPGRPIHVLELASPEASAVPRPQAAQSVLDAPARAAYRRRLGQLEEEIAVAAGTGDLPRERHLTDERDFIARELAAALGLGGRSRLLGDPVERARKAVGMRIAASIARVDQVLPQLARHLRASLRTGRFCSYEPEHPIAWRLRN